MADKKSYTVHRAMHGNGKDYERGETREMTEVDAAPLVASGALSLEGERVVSREAGVQHTYGQAPSKVNDGGYTSATGEGILPPRAASATKPVVKKPA